jgi:hypothetical protein
MPVPPRAQLCGQPRAGVAPQIHRRRSGMVRGALEHDLDPRDAGDRGHQAKVDIPAFQDNTLLDVQLEEGRDVGPTCIGKAAHRPADAIDRVA